MWFPEIVDQDIVGTASDMEGWSYYAREREHLNSVLNWVTNGQKTTGLGRGGLA